MIMNAKETSSLEWLSKNVGMSELESMIVLRHPTGRVGVPFSVKNSLEVKSPPKQELFPKEDLF